MMFSSSSMMSPLHEKEGTSNLFGIVLLKQVSTKDGLRREIFGMKCTFEGRPRVSKKLKQLLVKPKSISTVMEL